MNKRQRCGHLFHNSKGVKRKFWNVALTCVLGRCSAFGSATAVSWDRGCLSDSSRRSAARRRVALVFCRAAPRAGFGARPQHRWVRPGRTCLRVQPCSPRRRVAKFTYSLFVAMTQTSKGGEGGHSLKWCLLSCPFDMELRSNRIDTSATARDLRRKSCTLWRKFYSLTVLCNSNPRAVSVERPGITVMTL